MEPTPYQTLAAIDVGEHIERKGNLSYLSWAWAVTKLLEAYPEASWTFAKSIRGNEFFAYEDGTGEVRCTVKIGDIERTCSLPVMDHRNNAVANPNARQVNDTKQRCLAKAIALHGLGLYIYAGEDVPQKPAEQSGDWDAFLDTINGHHDMVLDFLRDKKILLEHQDFRDLSDGWRITAMKRPESLLEKAQEHFQSKQEVPV